MRLIFCLQINRKIFNKLALPFWVCVARHAQSTQNKKFTISLQYLKEGMKDEVNFFSADKCRWFLQNDTIYHFRCVWPSMPKLSKIINLLFLCNILRKKKVIKLIFCMEISMKACYKLILWFWWGWSSIPKVAKIASLQCLYNILKKILVMKLIFCTIQVDFNTLDISVFY